MRSRTHNRTNRIHDSIRILILDRLLTRIGLTLCPKSSIEFVCTTTVDNDQSEQPSQTKVHPIELQHYNHHKGLCIPTKNLISGVGPLYNFLSIQKHKWLQHIIVKFILV
ncbi:hypothetical protein Hanom_Chr16g01427341 [Helianthus anomalus]